MQRFEMYINGESCQSASGEWCDTKIPFHRRDLGADRERQRD